MPATARARPRWCQESQLHLGIAHGEGTQTHEPSPAASQRACWQEAGREVELGLEPDTQTRHVGRPRGSLTTVPNAHPNKNHLKDLILKIKLAAI